MLEQSGIRSGHETAAPIDGAAPGKRGAQGDVKSLEGARALNQVTRDPNIVSKDAQLPWLSPCSAVCVELSGNANTNNEPPRLV